MKPFVATFEQFENAFDQFLLEKKASKKDKLFAKTDNIPDNGISKEFKAKTGIHQSAPGKTPKLGAKKKINMQ